MLTRFAPAPTGLLHLGHVANAIYVWGLAARAGGEVLLRIEDHDRQRSRASYEAALLDDLDWLGFGPDRFPTSAFRSGPCESRQSDRHGRYADVARALEARGLLYACDCSRAQWRALRPDGHDAASPAEAADLSHTCPQRGLPLTGDVAWRLRLDAAVVAFDDLVAGPQRQEPSVAFGDPLIRDRAGNWTYQFAVVVDDFLQGIDVVIRGRDLLSSTGLQIQLARLIGRPMPARFAHHPLIMKSPAQKLSKSDGDTGIGALRADGWTAPAVIGLAAWKVGLIEEPVPVAASDVGALFNGTPYSADN